MNKPILLDESIRPYLSIDLELFDHLNANETRVYLHLKRRVGTKGEKACWETLENMSANSGVKIGTLRRALKSLFCKRVVIKIERPGYTSIYKLTAPCEWVWGENDISNLSDQYDHEADQYDQGGAYPKHKKSDQNWGADQYDQGADQYDQGVDQYDQGADHIDQLIRSKELDPINRSKKLKERDAREKSFPQAETDLVNREASDSKPDELNHQFCVITPDDRKPTAKNSSGESTAWNQTTDDRSTGDETQTTDPHQGQSKNPSHDLGVPPPELGIKNWDEFTAPGNHPEFWEYMLVRVGFYPNKPAIPELAAESTVRKYGSKIWNKFLETKKAPEKFLREKARQQAELEQQFAEAEKRDRESLAQAKAQAQDPYAKEREHVYQAIAGINNGDEADANALIGNYQRMLHTTLPLVGNCIGRDFSGIMPSKLLAWQKIEVLEFLFEQRTLKPKDRDARLKPQLKTTVTEAK